MYCSVLLLSYSSYKNYTTDCRVLRVMCALFVMYAIVCIYRIFQDDPNYTKTFVLLNVFNLLFVNFILVCVTIKIFTVFSLN